MLTTGVDSEEWSGNSEDSKDSDSEYEDSHPQKKKIMAEVTEEAPSTSCPSAINAEGHQGCEEPAPCSRARLHDSIWFSFVQLEFEVATMEAYVIPDYDLASGACNQKFRGLPTC